MLRTRLLNRVSEILDGAKEAPAPSPLAGKPRVVLYCNALCAAQASSAINTLLAAGPVKSARRLVGSEGPLDTPQGMKGIRLDKHLPQELLTLHNLAAASGMEIGNPVHLDGHSLLALACLARASKFDVFVLVRGVSLPDLPSGVEGAYPYRLCGSEAEPTVMFDGRHEAFTAFLASALELFLSGGAYAISPYTFPSALEIAACASDSAMVHAAMVR